MSILRKYVLYLFLLFFVASSGSVAYGENWILFNKSRDGTIWYYDSDSIVSPDGANTRKVWGKSIRTDGWRKELQETFDRLDKDIDAMSIDHILTLEEFHCSLKMHRFLKVIDRSKEGREIYSQDIQDSKWGMIPPRSIIESLFEVVCKE